MALHKDLTGADLHEPKGIESAAEGTVYVADGTGSGDWESRYSDILNLNRYELAQQIADVSTPNSSAFFYVRNKSNLERVNLILNNAITVADAVISVYVNGVLASETLTIPYSGSTAGTSTTLSLSSTVVVPAGSTVEVRSDGGSTTTAIGFVTLMLKAVE